MLAPSPIMRVGALIQRILDLPVSILLLLSHKYVTELFPLNSSKFPQITNFVIWLPLSDP